MDVLVYTNNGTQSCEFETALQADITRTYYYYMEFSDRPACDFTQVSAVQLSCSFPSIAAYVYNFAVATNGTTWPSISPTPTPSPTTSRSFSPSRTNSYILPTPGPTQVLDFGISVTVSVSASIDATFQTQQIDSSSVSSISFSCDTSSKVQSPVRGRTSSRTGHRA